MMWKSGFILLILMLSANTIYAKEVEERSKHTLIVVVPSFSFEEAHLLVDSEHEFFGQVAVGAMNVRPGGPYSYLNNMVTLSVGEKALGIEGWNSFEAEDNIHGVTIVDWMQQVKGHSFSSQIAHPYLKQLKDKNMNIEIGRFGRLLSEAGVKRNVYGHSDIGEEQVRYGPLLIMDAHGNADGELEQAVKNAPTSSFGKEMDENYLIHKLFTDDAKKQLTVIEWGDLYRLFKQRPFIGEPSFERKRHEQLDRLSFFLNRVIKETEVDEVWLLSPMMHTEAYNAKQLLAPIYHWGNGDGFLTSNTTRQPYLVSSIDVVPTILHSFGINVEGWSGHTMIQESQSNGMSHFFKKIDEMVLIYKSRAPVLSMYITCLVLALCSAAILNFLKGKKQWQWLTRLLLLSALSSPLLFLILGKSVTRMGVSFFVAFLFLTSVLCGFIAWKSKAPIFLIGATTFVVITIDLFLHSPLMQRSYLGYDPIIGARYYGIGNEFAGVYLISSLMMIYPFLNHSHKWLTWVSCSLLFIFLAFMLGRNSLGTNAGATLSASITFFYLLYQVSGFKWTWKKISLSLGICLVVGVLLLYLLQGKGEPSHIGVAFGHIKNGDFQYIYEIIRRKLEMNVKLFKHSNWTQLLVTSYVLGAIILWRKQFQIKGKQQQLFLQTGVVASFSLLLLNDSGVVAAATSMFCVISTYYYWLTLKEKVT